VNEKKKRGVTPEERRDYLARLGSAAAQRLPTDPTADFVWSLLEGQVPPALMADLIPKPEHIRTAKQSLVVALDCAVALGDRGAMLTKNALFDALAHRWSPAFQEARRRGARVSYDMKRETIERAMRELLIAGVRFDALWKIVTRPESTSGLNRLFSVRRAGGKGHALGYSVDLTVDSTLLAEFERAIEHDEQYRRQPQPWPLLLAENWAPSRRRTRQQVCEEQPYNVVNLGEGSERVLSILEGARVKFDVETFRADYEAKRALYLRSRAEPYRVDRTPDERRQYRKLKGFVEGWRRLYRQTETIPVETVDMGPYEPPGKVPRRVWIRSRFSRGLNRRYHAVNFWPERAPKEFRARWFSLPAHVPETDYTTPGNGPHEPEEHETVPAHTAPGRYVERDIVTSQVQTLAVFLGLRDLEARAVSKHPKLKEWLADRLWAQHLESGGRLLAKGYASADGGYDEKLVSFAKAHLMHFYGGRLSGIVRKCGKDATKYGPGWQTGRGGVTEAVDHATEFFVALPEWTNALTIFHAACRKLAEKRGGVIFHDPLDRETEIRWNHAQRGTVHVGHHELEIRPSGKGTAKSFVSLPAGTIDRPKLQRFLTPCLTHMLDATFSSLVVERLHAAGHTDIVALHDAWLVAETMPVPGDPAAVILGAGVLEQAIEAVGKPWLLGLEGVYDRLICDLGDDPTFGPFVHEIRNGWRARVKAHRWPKFLSD